MDAALQSRRNNSTGVARKKGTAGAPTQRVGRGPKPSQNKRGLQPLLCLRRHFHPLSQLSPQLVYTGPLQARTRSQT